jgi:hypothetical protein
MPVIGFLRSPSFGDAAHLIAAFGQGLKEAASRSKTPAVGYGPHRTIWLDMDTNYSDCTDSANDASRLGGGRGPANGYGGSCWAFYVRLGAQPLHLSARTCKRERRLERSA